MAFRRALAPSGLLEADSLTAAIVGIGMQFAAAPASEPNIEDTIVAASIEGMEHDDLRVLATLVTWLGVHSPWLNADRLSRLVRAQDRTRVHAFWSAFGSWRSKDHRFARLARIHAGDRVDLLRTGTDFRVRRHGEDPRFVGSALRVPANVLRDRLADVLTPAELARQHRAFRWRVIIGPSYRADAWGALEAEPRLTAAEVARRTYGSFATAWRAKRDFGLLGDAKVLPG